MAVNQKKDSQEEPEEAYGRLTPPKAGAELFGGEGKVYEVTKDVNPYQLIEEIYERLGNRDKYQVVATLEDDDAGVSESNPLVLHLFGDVDLRTVRGGISGVGGDTRVTVGGNLTSVAGQSGQTTTVPFADTTFVSLPAIGQGGYDPATVALSLFGAGSNRFLNLEISALEADGKGKVVSSPRVVTADQQKALIEQGEELPYQVATSSGATSLQFRKANLKLEVTPQITPEGNVILDVDITKDSVGRVTPAGFAINTKHVKTQVLVENGGTVVIGGIFEQNDREDVTKVPFLGDIPYLGNLFKTRTNTATRTEMLIFLTPKLVSEKTAAR